MTIAAFFLLLVFVMSIGAVMPLTQEEASRINNEREQLVENVSVQLIFGNNMMISLIMFVPVAGPIFGFLALYNTGTVFAAESMASGMPPLLIILYVLIIPVAWLEFLCYSTALAESVWLIQRARQGMMKRELKNAAILISIVAVTLLVAAIMETALVLYATGT
jgi:hypothetical protein